MDLVEKDQLCPVDAVSLFKEEPPASVVGNWTDDELERKIRGGLEVMSMVSSSSDGGVQMLMVRKRRRLDPSGWIRIAEEDQCEMLTGWRVGKVEMVELTSC
jgi:hypothetical protein